MKKLVGVLSIMSVLLLCGCAGFADSNGTLSSPGWGAGGGLIYSDMSFSAPTIHELEENGLSVGSRQGMAERESVLYLLAWGDSSIATAAQNGGITKIRTVNYRTVSVLGGVYARSITIVTGD